MTDDFWQWWLSPWALGLLGLCVGSFLNVVIHRLPLMLEQGWRLGTAWMCWDCRPIPTMHR